ncbi:MAG: membrane protein insertase YidC [Chlamydiales bacterium]|nr:membrane protein insertase YidC [Chlamydiia bacterium]MCP5507199.1 membrane protein insertase YidC [Chlamydiales bacterium]
MDKRTLFFVLSLSLTLFLVNTYFENQRQGDMVEWRKQEAAKEEKRIVQLREMIASKKVNAEQLPVVPFYSDASSSAQLGSGIDVNGALLAAAWTTPLPQTVYVSGKEYRLTSQPKEQGAAALYLAPSAEKLQLGYLPDFGAFDVQLITPGSDTSTPGEYVNGHLTVPAIELYHLLKKNVQEGETVPEPKIGNALVLLKSEGQYLPVAVYHQNSQKLTLLRDMAEIPTTVSKPQAATTVSGEETFYVLENDYMQLVFSSRGGALSEINLPFKSKANEESVVKEIDFDRDMVEYHPYNARFPSHPYTTASAEGKTTDHESGALGGYYPLIRRDLIQVPPLKTTRVPPQYYSMNIVSEYPEVAELNYTVKEFTNQKIVFEANQGHRKITKTYTLEEEGAPYIANLQIDISGDGRGLWLTSGIPEIELFSGNPAPALKYRITRGQNVEVDQISLPQDASTVSNIFPDWTSNSNGFFGLIMDPLTEIGGGYRAQYVDGNIVPSRLVEIDQEYQLYKPENMPGYQMMMPLNEKGGSMQFRIFAGPYATPTLKAVDTYYSDPITGYNPDYIGCQSFHGWFSFISEPFAKFLMILMRFFHSVTGSWGFSIILLTVALRIMLYPLNAWSTKSMVRMQKIAPEVNAIQAKYKKDPKKAQLEIMSLYREKGVNPMSGCFPILIQIPFLIGMFDLLKSTFELRGASFIPGWIDNLAAPDVLFSWSKPIFFFGTSFHLLPILLGGVMFLQQRVMSTAPKDPSMMTDQQRQQRAMGSVMPLVFMFMFYSFPSGLNLYWLSSTLLGIGQQWWTTKTMKDKDSTPSVTVVGKKGKR